MPNLKASLKKSNDVEHLKRSYFISKSFKNEAYPNFTIIVGRLKPSHVKSRSGIK